MEGNRVLQRTSGSAFEWLNNHLVLFVIDPQSGEILDANAAARNYYGCDLVDLTGRNIVDLTGEFAGRVRDMLEQARAGQQHGFYFTERRENGELRDLEVYSGPIRLNGQVLAYLILHDITERREAMEQIKSAYLELDQIFNAAGEGMCVIDNDCRVVQVNDRLLQMLGKTRSDVLGKKCYELYPGSTCHTDRCCLELVKRGETRLVQEVEKTICGAEEATPFLITVTPFFHRGELVGIVQSVRDLSQKKQAEETLRESETRYRRLFELLPDAVIVHSNGKIISLNAMAVDIFGAKAPAELIGRDIFSLIHPDYRNLAASQMEEAILAGKSSKLHTYKFYRVNGSVFEGETACSSFVYQGQLALQAVIRDITVRKKELEIAARIQQRRLDVQSPLPERVDLEVIYVPAKMISGDLFHLHKVDDHTLVGLIGDVTGKGITAALSNSAVKVMFYESASKTANPLEIVKLLNMEVAKYLDEEYVAACCFKLDFRARKFYIVGAGINTFFFCHNDFYCWHETVKGPSLGMLPDSLFDQKVLEFFPGDRFYFYTDGITDYLDDQEILTHFKKLPTIKQQRQYLEQIIRREIALKDDVTFIALEIKR